MDNARLGQQNSPKTCMYTGYSMLSVITLGGVWGILGLQHNHNLDPLTTINLKGRWRM